MNAVLRFCLVVVLLCMLCCSAADADLKERDFKRMKMKELRAFLDARGLVCAGCQEKNDFVRMAYENRDVKTTASASKRDIPDSSFWEAWAATARTQCELAMNVRHMDSTIEPYSTICDVVHNAVDSFMMQHSKQIASRLKKTTHHMLKTSYSTVYYDAGIKLLQNLMNKCLVSSDQQHKCQSLGEVLHLMEPRPNSAFKAWLTNVGIENTNPMYEIIHDHGDL